jgi:hypothetical protein
MNDFMYPCLVFLSAAIMVGRSDESPVAFVEKISGDVTLQTDVAKPRPLDPNSDVGLILNWGDTVNCISGSLVGVMPAAKVPTLVNLCGNQWNSGPAPGGVDEGLKAKMTGDLKDLRKYSRAGRSKGDENPIFDPPDHGATLAEKFVIRWRNRPPLHQFTAVLQDGSAELARVPGVDGAKGELNSAVLRQAIMSLRNSSAPSHEVQIAFRFENGSQQLVRFAVLTQDDERRLNEELAQVPQSGLFKFVQHAAIYDSFRLFDMVAEEYDSALAEAPESRELLRAALAAYARIGDLHRARELRDKLQQIEETSTN